MEIMSSDEFRAMVKSKNKKFGNRKAIHPSGRKFDSQMEMRRYDELLIRERAGEIFELECQPKFVLQDTFRRRGKTHRKITYRADFRYVENGQIIIEDVKGKRTEAFNIKWKWVIKQNPDLEFRIVKMK